MDLGKMASGCVKWLEAQQDEFGPLEKLRKFKALREAKAKQEQLRKEERHRAF